MKKRKMLAIGLAFFASLLTAVSSQAQSQPSFVIGGITALSGPYNLLGTSMQKGVELAIEQRKTLLAKPIVVRWEDSESKPQTSVQKASKLLAGGVNVLLGDSSSSQTLALMPLAEQRKIPLLVTTAAADQITGASRNKVTIRTTNQIFMEARLASAYAKKAALKSVYGVVVDQAVGRDAWAAVKANLIANGVTIIGQDFIANGSQDYSLIIDKVAKSGAEGLFVATGGADTITLLKQAGDVKLANKAKIFGVGILDDDVVTAVGPALIGVSSVARYHHSINSNANKKFVEAYRKKYNELPNAYAGHAFDGLNWLFDVIEKSGSWNSEVWISEFEKSTYANSIFGPREMRACDHQALTPGLWAEAKADPRGVHLEVTDVFPPAGLYPDCPK